VFQIEFRLADDFTCTTSEVAAPPPTFVADGPVSLDVFL
jgi:hypothetical protein